MAKALKTEYECTDCGARSPKWLGRCSACNAWSTLVEVRAAPSVSARGRSAAAPANSRKPVALAKVQSEQLPRTPTAIAELDRVLGGGLVPGAVVLIGGDPGIGKSTLLMQALLSMAQAGRRVLYVTGEESASQVALRAERLGARGEVMLLASNELSDVEDALSADVYDAIVVDSVQTIRAAELESAPGSVAQLREVAARLTDQAKQRDVATFLIGHVTKDGNLAGPKVLEHLVDVVLAFEGDPTPAYLMGRRQKKRFVATSEVGVFEMLESGLREVPDPSSLFIGERAESVAGSVVVPTAEGSRPMLLEVQALVAPAQYGAPRRVATGLDSNRLAVLLAVLARKAGVQVLDQDVFAGVAGGARVDEPAADLAVCAAIVSAFRDRAIEQRLTCFGEVGLTGELRAVPRAAARLAEARKLGFTRVVLPRASAERLTAAERKGLDLHPARRLDEALDLLF
ncbi:MAG: DNA repair protein RadA [Myxococcales bacterium]|nr:DNA repair protein RadA [Myxococcales bacterium]